MNANTLVLLLVIGLLFLILVTRGNLEKFSMQYIDIPGRDLTNQLLATEELCMRSCESDPKCLFYNYDNGNQMCGMKQGISNSDFEVGLNGNRLIHGNNIDINFNVLSKAPISDADECNTMSATRGHNIWKYEKTAKLCSTGKIGISRPHSSTGATGINHVCPLIPPQIACPICNVPLPKECEMCNVQIPPKIECPTCPVQITNYPPQIICPLPIK